VKLQEYTVSRFFPSMFIWGKPSAIPLISM